MRRALLFALLLAGCAYHSVAPAPVPDRSATMQSDSGHGGSPIQHVVIIVQENRTFNDLFNGFPGAYTTQVGLDSHGNQRQLVAVPLNGAGDWQHSTKKCHTAYDGGAMDGFDLDEPRNNPPSNYSYVQQSDVSIYWSMASQYALSDTMFASECGPSFPSHQYLIAGQTGSENNPVSGGPWGCDSPIQNPPCYDYGTLGELADRAHVSWRYYANTPEDIWSAYDAIRHVRYGSDWSHDISSPETNIIDDAQRNSLAQISWVVPSCLNSDHHGCGTSKDLGYGPSWVASVVDAIGESKDWSDTAIFITWDDWGGWYDPVAPQQLYPDGLGFRVPLIVISPYARAGYVSHVQHEFGSILHFTEGTFNLGNLRTRDAASDDLSDMFDYSQQPIRFQPFVHGQFDRSIDQPPADDDGE